MKKKSGVVARQATRTALEAWYRVNEGGQKRKVLRRGEVPEHTRGASTVWTSSVHGRQLFPELLADPYILDEAFGIP